MTPARTARWLILLYLLAAALPARAADAPAERVLLLTSPRLGELRNLVALSEQGLLSTEGLRVIGLTHRNEWTDYSAARSWISRHKPDWISIQIIRCDLDPETVFQKNDCTAEYSRLFAESDGIIFTGGPDIPPALYGQETRFTSVITDPPRHLFEIGFLVHLLRGDPKHGLAPLLDSRPDYLVLGLCLGMQTMNVATGGTLYQDIPSQVYGLRTLEQYARLPAEKRHRSAAAQLEPGPEVGWAHIHSIRFHPGPLARALDPDGKPVPVVSLHHQAVHKLGRGLRVLATSTDGKVIEAVAHKKYKSVFGVQFHPEKRIIFDPNQLYRARVGAPVKNHIQATLAKTPRALAFEKRFWTLIQTRLTRSAKSRAAR